jgi:hypothetical protein
VIKGFSKGRLVGQMCSSYLGHRHDGFFVFLALCCVVGKTSGVKEAVTRTLLE